MIKGSGSSLRAVANEALAYVDALHNLARHLTREPPHPAQQVREVEVSDVLGSPVGTVKSRLSRARAAQTEAEKRRSVRHR